MRRRNFLSMLGGATAWPLAARAQRLEPTRRIGVLSGGEAPGDQDTFSRTFVERLKQLGWIEGRTVQIDYRAAGGDAARFATLARELIDLKPDVLVARSNSAVTALQHANRDVPIVFTQVSDPIGRGFVATLARP